ncbi:hypothetical protein V5799_025205 [Amblyomma americanum]|uniref:Alpha-macroglobulin-like TED domain-containing protein n=1 Tax=Amblyomma americanum TaxID=6943 RepID=A0AAQ4E9V7_AMBAM
MIEEADVTTLVSPGGTNFYDLVKVEKSTLTSEQAMDPTLGKCRDSLGENSIPWQGDDMGAASEAWVKNLVTLLRMPLGSGEQTMMFLAPALYTYEYLKTASRISPEDEDRALGFIRSGYHNILTFRKSGRSFAFWPHYNSSLWLTAFVVRTLCEAQKSILIDENVITSGLRYILTQQKQDGSFHDIYNLLDGDLLGGVNGPVPLTAYTRLTLQECAREGVQVIAAF